jgi:hypothetical protein
VRVFVGRLKTVGGAIVIAAITKHEGPHWVQRQDGFGATKPEALGLIEWYQAGPIPAVDKPSPSQKA